MLLEIWYQTHFLHYEYFKQVFSQHFLNYNFHIILNNNTWNLLLNKPLATTLSDAKPATDLGDNDKKGTFMAFTTTIDSSKESEQLIDEDKDLMESKFEKMDENDDIHSTYGKLYKNSEKYEKL